MTVTPDVGARVIVTCLEDASQSTPLRAACTFGPFLVRRTFSVSGQATVTTSAATLAATLGNVLFTSAGAPASAVQASANVNPTGAENGLTFTAREYGVGGNEITITYVDPGANSAALSVSVAGKSIIVRLATGEAGAITSTAAEVLAAIEVANAANELVTVAIMAGDTGDSDDGSGVVTAMASTALASGAGFGIAVALPGALCIDTTNGFVYRNSGSQAQPTWTKLGDAA